MNTIIRDLYTFHKTSNKKCHPEEFPRFLWKVFNHIMPNYWTEFGDTISPSKNGNFEGVMSFAYPHVDKIKYKDLLYQTCNSCKRYVSVNDAQAILKIIYPKINNSGKSFDFTYSKRGNLGYDVKPSNLKLDDDVLLLLTGNVKIEYSPTYKCHSIGCTNPVALSNYQNKLWCKSHFDDFLRQCRKENFITPVMVYNDRIEIPNLPKQLYLRDLGNDICFIKSDGKLHEKKLNEKKLYDKNLCTNTIDKYFSNGDFIYVVNRSILGINKYVSSKDKNIINPECGHAFERDYIMQHGITFCRICGTSYKTEYFI